MKKQNKKILFVCPYFPPHIGGLEKYVYNIAVGLQKKYNWEVIVVTTDRTIKQIDKKIQDGIKIYWLPVTFTFSNTPVNPLWYFHLKRIIEEEQPDLINAHAPVPFLPDLAALASDRKKLIFTYHGGSMVKKNSLFNIPIFIYEHFFLKFTLAKAGLIICSSDFIRNGFLKKYSHKSITINPGVDKLGKFNKIKSHTKVMFIAGLTRAEKYKGLTFLMRALAIVKKNIKNVRLTVVGEGDAVPMYKKLARNLRIEKRVVFTGALFGEKLKQVFRQSDVLVLPSSKESFGMVLIEAMAQGTPVIGTKVGGMPDIISDGHDGFLVRPENIKELSESIVKILQDRRLAESMGKNGLRKVKANYLWAKQVKATHTIFKKIII